MSEEVSALGAPLADMRISRFAVPAVAWGVSLVAVGLPQVVVDILRLPVSSSLSILGLAVVLAAFGGSIVWASLRPLTPYFLVLVIMQPAVQPALWPVAIGSLRVQLPAGSPELGGELVRELALALVMIGALAVAGHRKGSGVLGLGRLSAPAKPVRWLLGRPISWVKVGPISAVAIGLGTLAFIVLNGGVADTGRMAALLPGVALIAGLNAFNEEVVFRAGPLTTLRAVLGDRQTVLLVVALFAVPHYFGVPFGVVGMAMAGVFAWWVTKSVLETRGLFWAWAIHALQDVVIFSFIVTGAFG